MNDAIQALEAGQTFLTAGGTETYLLFQQGFPLREGCAFEVFDDEAAWTALQGDYLGPIFDTARRGGYGLLLDTLVWRAQSDFFARLGYAPEDLERFNRLAVERTREAAVAWHRANPGGGDLRVILAGDVGPRGDGYKVSDRSLTPEGAQDYHCTQIATLARAGAELVCGLTLTTVAEAIGVARAAREHGLPVVISPTVETAGTLPDGTPLGELIRRVDDATACAPLFYMVNCAHPTHVAPTLARAKAEGADWLRRFQGIRANASRKSHVELDESPELDRGDPHELGREIAELQRAHGLRVLGGCCGTDAEHIAAIAAAAGRGAAGAVA